MGFLRILYCFPTWAGAINAHGGLYLSYVISTSDSPWRKKLSQRWCDVQHCHTQCTQTFHWPVSCHMVALPTSPQAWGPFSFLLWKEVRKSMWEREIHHYLSVLCACGCDFLCFWLTLRTLWCLFWNTGFASITQLCDRHFDFIVRHHFCSDSHANRKGWLYIKRFLFSLP